MRHIGTITLRTERLVLCQFAEMDAEFMYKNWTSSENVTRYLRWLPHKDVQETRSLIREWEENYRRPTFYHWAIVLRSINEPIGSISVVDMDDNAGMVHIGYCLGEEWWHQGIATEALARVIDFFFEVVGAERVESQHDPDNPNSGRVMEKCKMRYERTIKNGDVSNRGIVDAKMYAITRADWQRTKEKI